METGCKERNTDDMTIIMMSFNMENIKAKQIKIFKRWSMQSQLNYQFNLTLAQLINWNKKIILIQFKFSQYKVIQFGFEFEFESTIYIKLNWNIWTIHDMNSPLIDRNEHWHKRSRHNFSEIFAKTK